MKRQLLCPTLLCLALAGSAALASAQATRGTRGERSARQTSQQTTPTAQTAQSDQGARTSADEEFDLDIPSRQFTRRDFQASTSVGIGGEQGLNLQIGVGVSADEIGVSMRNVRGHVRFRGSLEQILERLRAQARSPTPP